MNEFEGKLLQLQGEMDQLSEFLRTIISPLVASHYKALRKAGVPAQAATMLALDLQGRFLTEIIGPQ